MSTAATESHTSPETFKTTNAMAAVFDARFKQLKAEEAANPSAELAEKIAATNKAYQSFIAYKDAVTTKQHASMVFVGKHATKGYTPEAWATFSTALMLRVLPTTNELLKLDEALRRTGTHVGKRVSRNYGDEVGFGDLQSHVQLLFNSIQVMQHSLGITLAADYETYEQVFRLIQQRVEGKTYPLPESTLLEDFFVGLRKNQTVSDEILDAISKRKPSAAYVEFCNRLAQSAQSVPGTMPGIFQDGGSAQAPETSLKYYGLFGNIPHTSLKLPPALQAWSDYAADQWAVNQPDHAQATATGRIEKIDALRADGLKISIHPKQFVSPPLWREYQFETAQRIAALLPDSIINYRQQTDLFGADIKDEGIEVLARLINTQTREGSSAGPASVMAFRDLVRANLGYVDKSDRFAAQLWAEIHVSPVSGVESRHASDLLELTTGKLGELLAHSPEKVTAAFDYVMQHGYPVIDPYHWDKAMEAAEAANSGRYSQAQIPPKHVPADWATRAKASLGFGQQRT